MIRLSNILMIEALCSIKSCLLAIKNSHATWSSSILIGDDCLYSVHTIEENKMKLWSTLFSTDYGLMSIGVILFIIGMAIFFILYFLKNLKDEETGTDMQ